MTVEINSTQEAFEYLDDLIQECESAFPDGTTTAASAALAYLRLVTAPVTDARLAEIEARAEAATVGEWKVNSIYSTYQSTYGDGKTESIEFSGITDNSDEAVIQARSWGPVVSRVADADFIAHARADVPYLLAEVKRLCSLQQGPSPVAAPAAGAETGLEPCPLCGSQPTITAKGDSVGMGVFADSWFIGCDVCEKNETLSYVSTRNSGIYTQSAVHTALCVIGESKEDAVRKWNTRPLESALRQELAAAQEQYRAAMGNLIARKLDLAEARREADFLRLAIRSTEKANEVRVRSVVRENHARIQALEAGQRRLVAAVSKSWRDWDFTLDHETNEAMQAAALLVEEKGEAK